MSFTVGMRKGTQSSDDNASTEIFMNGKKPLNAVIIGGSCSGLFAGILLKRQGHNVRILESARSNEREGTAAGVGLSLWVRKFFDDHDRLASIPIGVTNDTMTVLNQDMKTVRDMPTGMRMTTWDAAYYRLRANFDGLKSQHCQNPPDLSSDPGTGVFETGKRVLRVERSDNISDSTLKVFTEDLETQATTTYEADIVVAADGANSTIRRQLMPQVQREEPGYVLWRGTVPTKALSKEVLDRLEGNTFLYRMPYSYCIIYTIPGLNGTLAPGTREINFAWYTWKTRSEITQILTDTNNHQHRTTLPKGLMQPEIWKAQLAYARKHFHPHIYELISSIPEPFVSVISNLHSPRAAFFNDRLFLIGDALAQKQPNTGLGISVAAKNALDLGDMIAGKMGVREWEDRVVEDSERERLRSVAFGAWFVDGWFGWAWYAVRYRWVLMRQRWCKWLFGRVYPGLRARDR